MDRLDLAWFAIPLCLACCTGGPEPTATVALSGNAFAFAPGNLRLEGGRVTLLEHPEASVVSAADGAFRFEGLEAGSKVTVVLQRDVWYAETQTKTFTLGDEDLERVSLHAPEHIAVQYLAARFEIDPDESRCQIASTITRVGLSLYDEVHHGLAGATASIDPPLPPEHGPFYFDETTTPDLSLEATTIDGGVAFLNVPPGLYTLSAHEGETRFLDVEVSCRPGVVTNASPPYGLQALD